MCACCQVIAEVTPITTSQLSSLVEKYLWYFFNRHSIPKQYLVLGRSDRCSLIPPTWRGFKESTQNKFCSLKFNCHPKSLANAFASLLANVFVTFHAVITRMLWHDELNHLILLGENEVSTKERQILNWSFVSVACVKFAEFWWKILSFTVRCP